MRPRKWLRRTPVFGTLGRGGRKWSRIDSLVGILGLLVAVAALVIGYLGYLQDRRANEIAYASTSTTPAIPQLQLVKLEAKRQGQIDAEVYDDSIEKTQLENIGASSIDVTVKNDGSSESLITRADLQFTKIEQLENCGGGAGPLTISAEYDVKVPARPPNVTPFVLHRDMRFVVEAGDHERFGLNIGPERFSDGDWPWLYEVEVTLQHDMNQSLRLGTLLLVAPVGTEEWALSPSADIAAHPAEDLESCAVRNAERVQDVYRRQGVRSSDLEALYKKLQDLGYLDTGPAKEVCTRDAPSDAPVSQIQLDIHEVCALYTRRMLRVRVLASPGIRNEVHNSVEIAIEPVNSKDRYIVVSSVDAVDSSTCFWKDTASPDLRCEGNKAEWREQEVLIEVWPPELSNYAELRMTMKLGNARWSSTSANPDSDDDSAPERGKFLVVRRGR